MVDDIYPTAPDGPMVPSVRLGDFWPWVLIAVGGLLIAVGGTLLGPTGHDPSTVPAPETSWGAR